jgi:ribonuclease HII
MARRIACVDEVGRGCLFGPVTAACVICPDDTAAPTEWNESRIRDSKKIGKKERAALNSFIKQNALAFGVGHASVEEIDAINILRATHVAMHRALDAVWAQQPFDEIRVDGNSFKDYRPPGADPNSPPIPHTCIVQGDARERGIAAASIVAKEHRDQLIRVMVKENPSLAVYDLVNNMGYGTPKHLKAIWEQGVTEHHRRTYKISKI